MINTAASSIDDFARYPEINRVSMLTPVYSEDFPWLHYTAEYLSPLTCVREAAQQVSGTDHCTSVEYKTSILSTALKVISYIFSCGILPLLAVALTYAARSCHKYYWEMERIPNGLRLPPSTGNGLKEFLAENGYSEKVYEDLTNGEFSEIRNVLQNVSNDSEIHGHLISFLISEFESLNILYHPLLLYCFMQLSGWQDNDVLLLYYNCCLSEYYCEGAKNPENHLKLDDNDPDPTFFTLSEHNAELIRCIDKTLDRMEELSSIPSLTYIRSKLKLEKLCALLESYNYTEINEILEREHRDLNLPSNLQLNTKRTSQKIR